jgi:hypothetical protein
MVVLARFVSGFPSVPVVGSVYETVTVDCGAFTFTLVAAPHCDQALESLGASIPTGDALQDSMSELRAMIVIEGQGCEKILCGIGLDHFR